MKRKLLLAVIGSGVDAQETLTLPLGRGLAELGVSLINGGGGGVMDATARGFISNPARQGKVVGVIPSLHACDSPESRKTYRSPEGYPNSHTDLVIRTHLPLSGKMGKDPGSRNHLIILSADGVIALPGSQGTRSEIELALEYGKPLLFISPNGEWAAFSGQAPFATSVAEGLNFIRKEWLSLPPAQT
ncbi:MAG: DNA-binding protein [Nitrospinae bacterium CG11_big_fil_rev_8_21_14_0_20_56_8]|nr:MAG: DNA-binding protein [Nitrospinae bacterium CG11_big_fil_rev_8_21_14_0_20_56_8]